MTIMRHSRWTRIVQMGYKGQQEKIKLPEKDEFEYRSVQMQNSIFVQSNNGNDILPNLDRNYV